VPDDILSYRQNLTALIENEKFNPWGRTWWGGTPKGWADNIHTTRSGVCLTKDNFVGYFWGVDISAEVLATSMIVARCTYGVHLDMNAGHTGLEFYRTGRTGTLPKLPRKLDEVWEAAGPIPDAPGWEFMGRRMIKYMALMNFPRYVNAEARDFFYLTLRYLLPGDPAPTAVVPAEEGEGAWRTQGLPQRGWPHAVATTNVRPDSTRQYARVGLIKIDPKFVRIERPGDVTPQRILEFRSVLDDGPTALWHSEIVGFRIGPKAPEPTALRVTAGMPAEGSDVSHAQAALGIDAAGMLIYARVTEGPEPGRDGVLLLGLLHRMNCESVLLLPHPLGAVLSSDEAPAANPDAVIMVRAAGPGARRIFPNTPIVLPKRWAPLQAKRVRQDASDR
jgi:hypothetical protein